jgi:hypothetical protein
MPLSRSAALNREPRRFVEDNDRIVAVEDRGLQHGLVSWPETPRHGLCRFRQSAKRRHSDRLTRRDAVAGAGSLAVDADLTRTKQFFELAMTQCRIVALEPPVEA